MFWLYCFLLSNFLSFLSSLTIPIPLFVFLYMQAVCLLLFHFLCQHCNNLSFFSLSFFFPFQSLLCEQAVTDMPWPGSWGPGRTRRNGEESKSWTFGAGLSELDSCGLNSATPSTPNHLWTRCGEREG